MPEPTEPTFDATGRVVLLIEENWRIRDNISAILARRGYAVTPAPTVTEARETLAARRPDAAALSISLNDGGALAFLSELQAAQIPVLLIAETGSPEWSVAELVGFGGDYLINPFEAKEIARKLDALTLGAGFNGKRPCALPRGRPENARKDEKHRENNNSQEELI
jgi:DNA-binding response OmpR family regulator